MNNIFIKANVFLWYYVYVMNRVNKKFDLEKFFVALEEVNDLDLSYTPPLGSPRDPLQTGAQAWTATR